MSSSCLTTPCWFTARAIWFKLFPIRAIWRTRSFSAAVWVGVHARTFVTDFRTRPDTDTPALSALVFKSAYSDSENRQVTILVFVKITSGF